MGAGCTRFSKNTVKEPSLSCDKKEDPVELPEEQAGARKSNASYGMVNSASSSNAESKRKDDKYVTEVRSTSTVFRMWRTRQEKMRAMTSENTDKARGSLSPRT